jgi:outer membrane protein assembly factor BamB
MASSPVIARSGRIFIGGGFFGATSVAGRSLLALDPADGAQIFAYTTSDAVFRGPAIGVDGTVYFGAVDGLYAIDQAGNKKWSLPLTGSGEPAIGDDGRIYAPTDQGFVAVTPSGTVAWTFPVPGSFHAAVGSDGTIYFGAGDKGGGAAFLLYALAPDGTQRWAAPVGTTEKYPPAIDAEGTIYYASGEGNVRAFAPDGTQKWAYQAGGTINAGVALADHVLYVGSNDGYLYAIGP